MRNFILMIAIAIGLMLPAIGNAQIANPYPPLAKQVAAPLPKLALLGAVGTTVGRKQYHKVTLTITNRDKYDPQMFAETQLPPNPCSPSPTRVVTSVYEESGALRAKCQPARGREALAQISFLLEKGKPIPDFVYVVMTDLKTGAPYRSNLVSPSTGQIK